jgi:hypothetical protein
MKQQDFSSDFRVSSFVGLEQRRASQIGEQNKKTKKTQCDYAPGMEVKAFGACDSISARISGRCIHMKVT